MCFGEVIGASLGVWVSTFASSAGSSLRTREMLDMLRTAVLCGDGCSGGGDVVVLAVVTVDVGVCVSAFVSVTACVSVSQSPTLCSSLEATWWTVSDQISV